MASTITTFFTFSASTKARSSQVNNNFDAFRGDLIPINSDTASSSDGTHNMGLASHRWLGIYGNTLDLKGSTTTASLVLTPDTSDTLGSIDLICGGITIGVWGSREMGFLASTATSFFKFVGDEAVTNGSFDIMWGSSTQGTWSGDGGLGLGAIGPAGLTVTSAPVGQFLLTSSTTVSFNITNTSYWTIGNFTINARGGGVVEFSCVNGYFQVTSSASGFLGVSIELLRGTTITGLSVISQTLILRQPAEKYILTNHFSYFDTAYSAGEVVYQLRYQGNASNGAITALATHLGSILIKEH